GGQLLDSDDVVGDLIDRRPWVGDLEIHDGVDRYGQVVLGDHRLGWERHHLLAEVDPGPDPVQERPQPDQPGTAGLVEPAESLDHRGLRLRDDLHRADENDDDKDDDDDGDDQYRIHDSYGPQITTAVAPRTSTTVTDVPGGMARWPSRMTADHT